MPLLPTGAASFFTAESFGGVAEEGLEACWMIVLLTTNFHCGCDADGGVVSWTRAPRIEFMI